MVEVIRTSVFDEQLSGLRESRSMARVVARLDRLASGNFDDVVAVGGSVSEFRINYGPGFCVYCLRQGWHGVVLLYGGDKPSQNRDIKQARALTGKWKD